MTMHNVIPKLTLLASMLLSCSFIIDVVECEDNSDCILEDGTQLVCTRDNVCVSAPAQGEDCSRPSECLEPLLCVAPDPDQSVGYCALACSDSPCQADGELCCELDNGVFACVPSALCTGQ